MTIWIEDFIRINKHSRPGLKLKGRKKGILHYTANSGAGAKNHQRYFNNLKDRYASAHIFVDKDEARLIIPLDEVAYAANDGTYRGVPELRPNANYLSISVEMCQEKDGSFHPNTIARTEDVFVELSKMYGWDPLKDIVRHYDVTRKNCPAPWVRDGQKFIDFKNRVAEKLSGKQITKPKQSTNKIKQSKPSSSTYTGKSIVEYLNSIGVDSSQSNRRKLARKYGVKNYDFSASKNIELLNKMRNKNKPTPTTTTIRKGDMKTNSVVVYLQSIGEPHTYNYRKKLAEQYGIKNYRGSAQQNLTLLTKLRSGSATAKNNPKGDMQTGSIVNYLKSIGVDSGYNNRKRLAAQHGIRNYRGTAAQNTTLLRKMRR